jgi:hypothetical protein
MKLSIFSHWKAERWTGEIPDPASDVEKRNVLEYVFRYFNRVDPGDGLRLEEIGYLLPSLSIDDEVEIDGRVWRCAPLGWVEVTS